MSLDHLKNNLGKKCILEGARKGIESKQFYIVAKKFHFEKKEEKSQHQQQRMFLKKKKKKKPKFTKF
jgi:hypothetical protein